MHFIARSSLFVLLFVVFAMESAKALPVEDIYVAEVLVSGDGAPEFRSGARAGLLQVLLRVSGDPAVENSPVIAEALQAPETYYNQFSYESTDRTLLVGTNMVAAQVLRLYFEPSAISRLLRSGGFQVWGSNRPGVLLWVAVNERGDRRILSETDPSPAVAMLAEQAKLRGVPILFPLLDLEDESQISTAEIWGTFLSRIYQASLRYSPDCILTARIQQDGQGQWRANWAWYLDGDWRIEETVASSMDELVAEKVNKLANELADRYAIDSSRGQIVLRVESVDSLEQYAALGRYIESLAPVTDSRVLRVQGDEVMYELNTEGDDEALLNVIKLDEKMVLINYDERREFYYFRWME